MMLLIARAVAETRNDRLVSGLQSLAEQGAQGEGAGTKTLEIISPVAFTQSAVAGPSAAPAPLYGPLVALNRDFVGWLRVEGTDIDYPVLYKPEDPEYYIDKDFYGEPDDNGSLFLDGKCTLQSENLLVHGHNMKSGKMFGQLDRYKSRSFCEQHPAIEFDTPEEEGTYAIVAVFLSRVFSKREKAFRYYNAVELDSREAFDEYMRNIRKLALYDTGTDARYGDRLIMLSTCDNYTKNGRLVVVAKKTGD